MSQHLKSQAKRKRELAKLDKRTAKDQKRAQRKAERAGPSPAATATATATISAAPPVPAATVAAAHKPLTLQSAVERWKNSRVAPAKPRR